MLSVYEFTLSNSFDYSELVANDFLDELCCAIFGEFMHLNIVSAVSRVFRATAELIR